MKLQKNSIDLSSMIIKIAIVAIIAAMCSFSALALNASSQNELSSGNHIILKNTQFSTDAAPHFSLSSLTASDIGITWINWTWNNPNDPDFNHTMLYLNNVFQTNVSNTTNFYNETGLVANTTYEFSTKTVDIYGNINVSWTNDTATTLIAPDVTAPASITDLTASDIGITWINWTWNNPTPAEFDHTALYLNNKLEANVSNETTFYKVENLEPGTLYELSTKIVNLFGNVSSSWINDTAITLVAFDTIAPTVTIDVPEENHNYISSTIWLNVTANEDIVNWWYNINNTGDNTFSGNQSLTLPEGIHNINVIAQDIAGNNGSSMVNFSIDTIAPASVTGGGGGSSVTSERYENILVKDVTSRHIVKDIEKTFTFTNEVIDITYISVTANLNVGSVKAIVESLNTTSSLVSKPPEGRVYKNINIWLGDYGFEKRIIDSSIGFRVEKTWLKENNVPELSVRMSVYKGSNWNILPTDKIGEDDAYVYYEAIPSEIYSSFAIVEPVQKEATTTDATGSSFSEGIVTSDTSKPLPSLGVSEEREGIAPVVKTESKDSSVKFLLFVIPLLTIISVSYVAVTRGHHIEAKAKMSAFLEEMTAEKINDTGNVSDDPTMSSRSSKQPVSEAHTPKVEITRSDVSAKIKKLEESGILSNVNKKYLK